MIEIKTRVLLSKNVENLTLFVKNMIFSNKKRAFFQNDILYEIIDTWNAFILSVAPCKYIFDC